MLPITFPHYKIQYCCYYFLITITTFVPLCFTIAVICLLFRMKFSFLLATPSWVFFFFLMKKNKEMGLPIDKVEYLQLQTPSSGLISQNHISFMSSWGQLQSYWFTSSWKNLLLFLWLLLDTANFQHCQFYRLIFIAI